MLLGLSLLVTIFFCLGFGISCGYAAVTLVLRLMNYRPQPPAAAAASAQVAPASGD